MSRRPKEWAALGLLPLRQHWQQINREERQAPAELRAVRKASDAGKYVCIVSNAAGSRESPPVQVVIGKKP